MGLIAQVTSNGKATNCTRRTFNKIFSRSFSKKNLPRPLFERAVVKAVIMTTCNYCLDDVQLLIRD